MCEHTFENVSLPISICKRCGKKYEMFDSEYCSVKCEADQLKDNRIAREQEEQQQYQEDLDDWYWRNVYSD